MELEVVKKIRGLGDGNVLSITDATYAVKNANKQWPGLISQKKNQSIVSECSAVLFVGMGTVKSDENDKDLKNAMSILAVRETEDGNNYKIVQKFLFGHKKLNPTDLVYNMWKNGKMWLVSNESYTTALSLAGFDSFMFDCDFTIDPWSDTEQIPEIHRVANVSEDVWVFVTDYSLYRLELRGYNFFATEIWEHKDEKEQEHLLYGCPEEELDDGLRAIACVSEDCFLVGGDKLRLFVLRKDSEGKYTKESIDGFGAMVWDIAQIRENVWLVGGDGELRTLTLKNGRFELGKRIAGFKNKRIRTIYVAPNDGVIVGGKGFCEVLRIKD